MKIKLDDGAWKPTRSHDTDAGLDLYSPVEIVIPAKDKVKIDTGVHFDVPPGTAGLVKARSSMLQKGILTDGTVDEGYIGSVSVVLVNTTGEDVEIHSGDRIAQIVFVHIERPHIVFVNELENTERGESGFGSTGR